MSGEGRPTGNVEPIFMELADELKAHTDRLTKTLSDQLPGLNRMFVRIKKEPVSEK